MKLLRINLNLPEDFQSDLEVTIRISREGEVILTSNLPEEEELSPPEVPLDMGPKKGIDPDLNNFNY